MSYLINIKKILQKNKLGKIIIKIYHYLIAIPYIFFRAYKYKITKKKKINLRFYSMDETFDKIIEEKKSLCRFGDGEIGWIYQDSKGYFGQENSKELSRKLYEILISKDKEILIAIPNFFNNVPEFSFMRKIKKNAHLSKYYDKWLSLLYEDYIYTDALITGVYMGVRGRDFEVYFNNWKKVWLKKNILIIEGEQTRFGVGNDLLINTTKVRRILAPKENAFKKYEEIKKKILENVNKDDIVLICLGPTATILAYELGKMGIQSIDIGHLDIEYEWYLRGTNKKIKIPGKYINETGGESEDEIQKSLLIKYKEEVILSIN